MYAHRYHLQGLKFTSWQITGIFSAFLLSYNIIVKLQNLLASKPYLYSIFKCVVNMSHKICKFTYVIMRFWYIHHIFEKL